MRIEKINENKIKITITLRDLEERNIDLNSLNYNSPAAQELFWDMMEQAETIFGFNASESQLCVEASPDSSHGFIITITKFNDGDDFESIHKYIKNRFKKHDLKSKCKTNKICSPIVIYSFNQLEDLSTASKKIEDLYIGDSFLYKYKNIYYLILTKNNWDANSIKMFENILNEYGNRIANTYFYEGYLDEYGQKIAEYNALEIIKSYF